MPVNDLFQPFSGEFIKVKFQALNVPNGTCDGLDVTVDPFEVEAQSWSLNRTRVNPDASTGKHGRSRVRGPRDLSGTFTIIYNRVDLPHDPTKAGIDDGTIGTVFLWAECSDDPADAYTVDVIIDSVGDSLSYGDVLRQNVAFSLYDESSITYPSYS